MKLNLNLEDKVNLATVEYGDVVITEEGNSYLIVADSDNDDFVAVDLKNNVISDYKTSVYALFEFELEEKAVKIIKAGNLTLGVC